MLHPVFSPLLQQVTPALNNACLNFSQTLGKSIVFGGLLSAMCELVIGCWQYLLLISFVMALLVAVVLAVVAAAPVAVAVALAIGVAVAVRGRVGSAVRESFESCQLKH